MNLDIIIYTNQHASQGSYNYRSWTIKQGISFAFLTLSAKLSSKKQNYSAEDFDVIRGGNEERQGWEWCEVEGKFESGDWTSEVHGLKSADCSLATPRALWQSLPLRCTSLDTLCTILCCTLLFPVVLCLTLLRTAERRLAFSLQSSQLLCPWSILPRPRRTAGRAADSKPCTLYFPGSSVSPWSNSYDISVHWISIPKRTPSKSICISNRGFWTDPSPSPLLETLIERGSSSF